MRSKQRFTSALEPFAIIRLHASSPSRGELWTLQEAHVVRPFRGIMGDLKKMIGVGRALDFVRQLLPWHEPEVPIFCDTITLLEAAEATDDFRKDPLLAFAIRALTVVGLGPRIDLCPGCGREPLSNQKAYFDAARGSIVCVSCGGGTLLLSA